MSTIDDLKQQYLADVHGMQTGVDYDHARGSEDGTTKHLRVGINSAMVDHAALAKLLMKKGIITEIEYCEALAEGMRAERERYEAHLSAAYGLNIKLR